MKHISVLVMALLLGILVVGLMGVAAGAEAAADAATWTTAPQGGGWQVFPSNETASLYAVDMVSAGDGWAGGSGGLSLHFNGIEWVDVQSAFDYAFTGIDMVNSSYGWATTYQGKVAYYDGAVWRSGPAMTTNSLTGLSLVDGNNGWAIGFLGGIYRMSAGNWFEQQTVPYLLQGIDMLNASDGWIVGRTGATLHWNGTYWATVGTPQNVWLMDVDVVSATDAWAVGVDGVIWHWNGSAWTNWASPTTNALRSVHFLDASDGWAVGHEGTILHYDGSDWQVVPSPVTEDLHAVNMVSTDDGWIVGAGGTILHYTGPAGAPDLSTSTKTFTPRRAMPGDLLTSTITIRNSGGAVAPDVHVYNVTPANTTYDPNSATTTQGTIDGQDPLTVSLGDLGTGAEAVVTFRVTVGDTGAACWFVTDQGLITSEPLTTTVYTVARIGTCYATYLPLVVR